MPVDYSTVIGSGTTPHLAGSPVYAFPDGTFPVPSQRADLRTRRGDGVIILNPENFSVSIGLRQQSVAVPGGTGVPLPLQPLENRRSLVLHNAGPGTLYLGLAGVTSADGFPIAVNEKIAIDCQGTPNVTFYGVSDSTCDVRVLELA